MADIRVEMEMTADRLSLNATEGISTIELLGFLELMKITLLESMNDEPVEGASC